MKLSNTFFGFFAVVSLAFASGCSTTPREIEFPQVEPAKPSAPTTAVDRACDGNGGGCVASGLGDLVGRVYNAAKKQVNDPGNQAAVNGAWETTKDAAGDAFAAAKDKIQEVTK